ncbi:MAG TPA: YiiX/YebB-like N1pC/P60 family cysteine hydrolase [Bacteriovoracaceae bacterium]|nr:YiiX/YebB-like N1pC/P60 family cysteine hydrolase [Bacteriovoracaceae bacterium]
MRLLFLLLFLPTALWAQNLELKVGDILLQPLACWSCQLIEAEEGTKYAHSGLVVSTKPLLIAESISLVHAIPFELFNARTKKGEKLKVIRLKDQKLQKKLQQGFYERFVRDFRGLKFDPSYLWDNVDKDGRELLYCSEFISKLFEAHLGVTMPIKRMQFIHNRDLWLDYFNGRIPDGEWGNSPADFEKSSLFFTLGYL